MASASLLLHGAAEGARAQRQFGNECARPAELPVFHFSSSPSGRHRGHELPLRLDRCRYACRPGLSARRPCGGELRCQSPSVRQDQSAAPRRRDARPGPVPARALRCPDPSPRCHPADPDGKRIGTRPARLRRDQDLRDVDVEAVIAPCCAGCANPTAPRSRPDPARSATGAAGWLAIQYSRPNRSPVEGDGSRRDRWGRTRSDRELGRWRCGFVEEREDHAVGVSDRDILALDGRDWMG
jgi:hypothetical protein